MEGDLIKINEWLLPVAWLYGIGVRIRNELFEMGILKSKSYDIPVISVGNITVGGTGKTPHTEYLIRLLRKKHKVAVLSRGYKRKSKGFILATSETSMPAIGDEPYQMKQKFPDVYVAVDKNRRRGIERLCDEQIAPGTEVILLDDAFQHRYVKPGTNCPEDIKPMGFRVISKALKLYPYQKLFFSTLKYSRLIPLFGEEEYSLDELLPHKHVLLLTGIASPEQMKMDLEHYETDITPLSFGDHHYFSAKDVALINETYARMSSPKLIVTTEKDATRLKDLNGLSEEVRKSLYALPVEIEILQNQQESFNENITGYVFKNSRNSILAKK